MALIVIVGLFPPCFPHNAGELPRTLSYGVPNFLERRTRGEAISTAASCDYPTLAVVQFDTNLVDLRRLELLTPALQTRCSPN